MNSALAVGPAVHDRPFRPPFASQAMVYILMAPLIVFAVHGGFSFEAGSFNTQMGAVGGKIAVGRTEADGLRESLQTWGTLGLLVAAMFPHCRAIAREAAGAPGMLLLPLYAMLSAVWSQDPGRSFRSGVALLVTMLAAVYLAVRFPWKDRLRLTLWVGSCVLALDLVLALVWPQYGLDHQLHEGALQGLFTQKNVCAETTLFLLTPALALPGASRYGQVLRAAYLSTSLLVIALTQSRTGWVITAMYLAFFAGLKLLGRFGRRDLLPALALTFLGMGVLAVAAFEYSPLLLAFSERSADFSGRAQIWKAAVDSILRHPIGGWGFDAFWSVLQGEASRVFISTGWVVTSAHNGFLNVGLELGLAGVVLVTLSFVQAIRFSLMAFRPGRSPYTDWCIGILFLTLLYNLDERTLMASQSLPWVLYVLAWLGLAKAARDPWKQTRNDEIAEVFA